ncbi:hypothetical protein Hanom_Chr05g00452891 [Helianthus anomalus]
MGCTMCLGCVSKNNCPPTCPTTSQIPYLSPQLSLNPKTLQQRHQSTQNQSFGRRSVDRVLSTERRWCLTQPPVRAPF